MAKVVIVGDAMVIESSRTLEEIKMLEKYRPKSLVLFDEDGKTEKFKVATTTGKGSICEFGASFASSTKNEAKKACITLEIPAGVADAKAYAEETVGVAILHLNKIERNFEGAIKEVSDEKKAISDNITIA